METGYDKAIRLAGGPSKLAALLSEGKPKRDRISPQAVCNWKKRGGVPVLRCPDVERVLDGRVTCAELQPEFFGGMRRVSAAEHSEGCHG